VETLRGMGISAASTGSALVSY